MTFDDPFQLGTIQQISLPDGDAIPKRLESLGRANKCRYEVTVFDRLPNDLQSNGPSGAQYNHLHAVPPFRTPNAFGLSVDAGSHAAGTLDAFS